MLNEDRHQGSGINQPQVPGASFVPAKREELCRIYLELQRALVLYTLGLYRFWYRFVGKPFGTALTEDILNANTASEIESRLNLLRAFRKRRLVAFALFIHHGLDRSRPIKALLLAIFLGSQTALWTIFPSFRQWNYRKWIRFYDREDVHPVPASPLKIVVVLWNPPIRKISSMLESVSNSLLQPTHVIVISAREHFAAIKLQAKELGLLDLIQLEANSIEQNLREIRQAAGANYYAMVTGSGVLSSHALHRFALWVQQMPQARIFYGDEDRIDFWGRRRLPRFHPDWSSDYLVGQNCFANLTIVREDCLNVQGSFSSWWMYLFQQVLSLPESQVGHIPQILFHAFGRPRKDTEWFDTLKAVIEAKRPESQVVRGLKGVPRVLWPLPTQLPKVSAIIPTRDHTDLLRGVVNGLLEQTDYPELEIIIINNLSTRRETALYFEELKRHPNVRIVDYSLPFNFSAMNNRGFAASTGDIILMLNNDLQMISPGWLKEMIREVLRPEVGIVGSKLYFKNGFIQHAGVLMGVGQVSSHGHGMEYRYSRGYCNRLVFPHCYSAVTGACLAIRREVYERVGGLNEHLAVAYNDTDLCLRVRQLGLKVMWTPYAELYHLESATRGSDRVPAQLRRYGGEVEYMRSQWSAVIAADPHYNPNLTSKCGRFQLSFPPRYRPPSPPAVSGSVEAVDKHVNFS